MEKLSFHFRPPERLLALLRLGIFIGLEVGLTRDALVALHGGLALCGGLIFPGTVHFGISNLIDIVYSSRLWSAKHRMRSRAVLSWFFKRFTAVVKIADLEILILTYLARMDEEAGDFRKAVEAYELVARKIPDMSQQSALVHHTLTLMYLRLGDVNQAERCYRKAIQPEIPYEVVGHDSLRWQMDLAAMLRDHGLISQAIDEYQDIAVRIGHLLLLRAGDDKRRKLLTDVQRVLGREACSVRNLSRLAAKRRRGEPRWFSSRQFWQHVIILSIQPAIMKKILRVNGLEVTFRLGSVDQTLPWFNAWLLASMLPVFRESLALRGIRVPRLSLTSLAFLATIYSACSWGCLVDIGALTLAVSATKYITELDV